MSLSDFPTWYDAAAQFVRDNCTIESTAVEDSAVEALGAATSRQEAFEIVLSRMVLNFASAKEWAFFWHAADAAKAAAAAAADDDEDEDAADNEAVTDNTDIPEPEFDVGGFDVAAALTRIAQLYDKGVSQTVGAYFVDDDDDDDDSDDYSTESENEDDA